MTSNIAGRSLALFGLFCLGFLEIFAQGRNGKWLPILYQMRKECHEEVLDLATHVQVIRRNFGLAA